MDVSLDEIRKKGLMGMSKYFKKIEGTTAEEQKESLDYLENQIH